LNSSGSSQITSPKSWRKGSVAPFRSCRQNVRCHQLQQFASNAFFSGDYRAAALAGDRLRQQQPDQAAGWYWAVRAYQKLGVAALARAGDVEPDSPRIHALLGDVYQRRKMFREAQEEYSKMLALAPEDIAALAGLAAACLADGQLDQAQATARKALARKPADSEINLLRGDSLVAQHEYAQAEPFLERSLNARRDLLPRVHALLGRVLARTGRSKQAIKELIQGLASDEDGSLYYQLARLYQEAGDTKSAAAAFEKSKQILDGRDSLARETLTPIH
jgi:tetratricopeptide (TPR) repeat protein